ncbi:MAG: carboxypeptidase regulatory-like domain-containing protein [Gemmatimonadaceae bacterium]
MRNGVSARARAICGAVTCLALLASRLGAQAPTTRSITGVVTTDSAGSHGIGEVDVVIPALNLVARTNWLGEYRFPTVPAGTYVVEARHLGFKPVADSVHVLAAVDARLDFVLDQKAVTLSSVVSKATPNKTYISPNLNAFEERMNAHEGGSFIADTVLRKNEDHRLPEVLQSRVTGMTFFRASVGGATYAYSTRSTSAQCGVFQSCRGPGGGKLAYDQLVPQLCYVTVYLDGVRFGIEPKYMSRDNPPPDLNTIDVSDLAGVEFYPGSASVPMQYHSDNPCGTLLLWTREK